MDRLRHQRHAAKLLDWKERVGLCKYAVSSVADGVKVRLARYGEGDDSTTRASFEGLQTCGSVWHCPMCAARISETRPKEMNDLLAWAREQGHAPFLITLTARHGIEDQLAELLEKIKKAKQKLHQHRAWKRLKPHIVGHVTATEVTGGGRNGWHPHYHILLIVRDAKDSDKNAALVEGIEGLGDPWRASLRGMGLDGGGAAFDIQDATAAGSYVAKWGAAEEMSLSKSKKAYGENRTPQQLLAASCDEGDTRASALWSEYAKTFKGRRQLTWSPGLKQSAGIGEVSDEEAAANEAQEDQEDAGEAGDIDRDTWNGGARHRRGLILNAAEDRGAVGVQEVAMASEIKDPQPEAVELVERSEPPPPMEQPAIVEEYDPGLEDFMRWLDEEHERGRTNKDNGKSDPHAHDQAAALAEFGFEDPDDIKHIDEEGEENGTSEETHRGAARTFAPSVRMVAVGRFDSRAFEGSACTFDKQQHRAPRSAAFSNVELRRIRCR